MAGDIHVALGKFSDNTRDFRDNVYNPITKSAKAVKSYSGGGKNSITALSKDLIMQFPVLMSAGVPTDDAMTIVEALQKKYAALHLAIWSADTAFGTDASQNGIRDFVRRYHNNNDIPDLITYGGNLLTNISDITGALRESVLDLDDPNYKWGIDSIQFLDDAQFVDANELASLWDIPDMKFATESINDMYTPDYATIDTINDIAFALEASTKDRYSSQKAMDKITKAAERTKEKVDKQTQKAAEHQKKLIEKQDRAEKMERLKNINQIKKDNYTSALHAAKANPLAQDKRYEKYTGDARHVEKIKDVDEATQKASKTRADKFTKELQKVTDKYGAAAAQQMVNAGKLKNQDKSEKEKKLEAKRKEFDKMDEKDSNGAYKYGSYEYGFNKKGEKTFTIKPNEYATSKEREKAFKEEKRWNQRQTDLRRNERLMQVAGKAPGTIGTPYGENANKKDDMAKIVNAEKINSITPTLLDVSFLVTGGSKGGMLGNSSAMTDDAYRQHAIVGVKCMTRIISPSLMIPNIISSCQDSSLAFKWVKWTKGEMKVAKDMIFNISRIKEDAHAQNMADKWFAALRKRKRNANTFKFGGNTGINPFTTIVITDEDAMRIKEASGYDLYNVGTARKFMDNLYLLGFMIVNTNTGMTSTLYDGFADFEDVSVKSLKISNKDSKSDLETINDIFKRMGRI